MFDLDSISRCASDGSDAEYVDRAAPSPLPLKRRRLTFKQQEPATYKLRWTPLGLLWTWDGRAKLCGCEPFVLKRMLHAGLPPLSSST